MNWQQIDTIIWDWNGTLLNDVQMCINCMNQLLKERNLENLDLQSYRQVFTFPVQEYYQKIGIDFDQDPFDIIGHKFMELYFKNIPECSLHHGAKSMLLNFKERKMNQYILSAMEQNALEESLKNFGISHIFKAVYGIDNHLASGKTQRALQMIQKYQIIRENTVIIGDTVHDKEVGDLLGIQTVLLDIGHQSKSRLLNTGASVLSGYNELLFLHS